MTDIVIMPGTGPDILIGEDKQRKSLVVMLGTYNRTHGDFSADYHVCEIWPGKAVEVFAAQHAGVIVSEEEIQND